VTTTHDTAAALEAAIDAYGNATAREAENADERAALHRAITAHVEAEVARRLAAAPEVEAAIETHGDACYERGFRHALKSDAVDSELDAAYDRLRAAFAADKARAVESARLTPDEARRLVEAFAAAHGALVLLMHGGQYDPFDDEGTRRSAADTARTALLRALGVEA